MFYNEVIILTIYTGLHANFTRSKKSKLKLLTQVQITFLYLCYSKLPIYNNYIEWRKCERPAK